MVETVGESPARLRVGVVGQAAAALDRTAAADLLGRLAAAAALPPGLGAAHSQPRLLCHEDGGLPYATPPLPLRLAAEAAGWAVLRVLADAPAAQGEAQAPPSDALVLDGSPDDPAAASAAAAGVVARNCDVLVALGDVRAEPLLAGCADQALGAGVPVLWLSSCGGGEPARLLLDRGWRVARKAPPEGEAAWNGLRRSVLDTLKPPPGSPPEADRHFLRESAAAACGLPDRRLWRTHRAAMEMLWRAAPSSPPPSPPSAALLVRSCGDAPAAAEPPRCAASAGEATGYWAGRYARADALASAYADRYRSSYAIVLLLAALALIAAVLGLASAGALHPLWTALPEAAFLAGIIVLVRLNTRLDWRSQLILCRLFAELCRKQGALALLGRSLPASRIARMTGEGDLGWVGWRFAGAVRAAPPPTGLLAGPHLAAARDAAAAVLLRGQREYHAARAEAGRQREARLVQLGGWAFALTVACVAVKLVLLGFREEHAAEAFGLVAALLPAAAAALFGLRAYAELELLVQHSERMIAILDEAQESLDRTDTDRPLASQHVGAVLEEAATAMLADVEGWIQISRVKPVEAG